jgi:hypothetical protein
MLLCEEALASSEQQERYVRYGGPQMTFGDSDPL